MAKKKANFGGKLLIAAACAATIAQFPISQVNAYSEGIVPVFATTLGISGSDWVKGSVVGSDGNLVVVGVGEINGSTDTAVIAKYSPKGEMIWGTELGGTQSNGTYMYDVEQLKSGNYLAVGEIDGVPTAFEIDGEDGSVVTASDIRIKVTSIALDESFDNPQFVGVDGENASIYLFSYNPQSPGYMLQNATNIQDGKPIRAIESNGNNGYVAVGFDNTGDDDSNSSVLYYGDRAGAYPTIRTILSRGTVINNVIPYGDSYIGVGQESGCFYIAKINSEGSITDDYILGGGNAAGKVSEFHSVKALDNGEIVAVGTSNYTSSAINPKGGSDGVIARFSSDINLISALNPSGEGDDELYTVATNGNKFYVGGSSTSLDIGIEYSGNEMYSIIAGYGQGVTADVTFHIDGDIPEGVDAPEDGEYHFTEDGNDLPIPGSTDNQLFSGWYTDEGLEDELGDQVPSDDLDLYGKYFDVETENLNDLDTFDHWCEYQNEGTLIVCTNPEDNTITAGETSDPFTPQVPSVVMDDAATGKWVSDDPTIATVDQNGKVTGVSEGTTNIRFIVYDENGNIIYEYVLSFTVKAAANPDTVDVTPMILTIAAFSAVSFAAIFRRAFNKR